MFWWSCYDMAIRIPWTKHEVALLIDACICFDASNCSRSEVIKDLSRKLRELAVKNGLQIDEIYRNENGIAMQFTIMQSLLNDTESGLHNASKLFVEMKDLYYEDNREYKRILREAQAMLDGDKKNQDKFVEWLSTQVSPAQLSELYLAYEKIDNFCTKRSILKKPLLETTDVKTVNKVLQTVEQNKVFRFLNKREINKIVAAARFYYKYIKIQEGISSENPTVQKKAIGFQDSKAEQASDADVNKETVNVSGDTISGASSKYDFLVRTKQDEHLLAKYPIAYKKVMKSLRQAFDVVGEEGVTINTIYENIRHIARLDDIEYILQNASWAKKIGSKYAFSQEIIADETIESPKELDAETNNRNKVDFDNLSNLAFTKPIFLSYFGEEIVELKSWTELYVYFIKFLYEDYPDKIPVGIYFHGANRIDFGDFQKSKNMVAPKKIADDLYVETNLSATNIVGKIKALLDHCLIDYENVEIVYESKDTNSIISKSAKLNSSDGSRIDQTVEETSQAVVKQIKSLLKASFQYGIRLSSVRDIMRFRLAAEEAAVRLPENDEELKTLLLSCGAMIDDKLFAKNENMEDELREKIEAIFEAGFVIIYYESLFYAESEWMERNHISSDDILKDTLKQKLPEYNYTRVFFTKGKKETEFNALSKELIRIWGENAVAEIAQLSKELPYVPYENIQRVLFATNHFVWASEGHYLLVDKLLISEQEQKEIIEFVEESCKKIGYASLTDIPLGSILENNSFVSGNPLYTAIYNKILSGKYRNNGKILTIGDETINIVSLLSGEFCNRQEITFDEVNNRVIELNGGTKRQASFEVLYGNFVRISEDNYVAPKKLHFDIEEIDRVLSDIYPEGFGAIKDVTTFAMFPVCGVTWNHYVLESYCYRYSQKFYLNVLSFNSKNAGIIATKKSNYSYDQMLAIALANSSVDLNETDAGEYLFQRGMMAKRKYNRLGEIISEAQKIRKGQ